MDACLMNERLLCTMLLDHRYAYVDKWIFPVTWTEVESWISFYDKKTDSSNCSSTSTSVDLAEDQRAPDVNILDGSDDTDDSSSSDNDDPYLIESEDNNDIFSGSFSDQEVMDDQNKYDMPDETSDVPEREAEANIQDV
uniref:Uncharacterized protein n=1 Tax=Caenorhabditis japonica TaxID=281687 RepID=A0A8R1ECN6_CAEJA